MKVYSKSAYFPQGSFILMSFNVFLNFLQESAICDGFLQLFNCDALLEVVLTITAGELKQAKIALAPYSSWNLEYMNVFLKYSQQYQDDPLLFSNSLWRSLMWMLVLMVKYVYTGLKALSDLRTTEQLE